jgi:site-specific DNA-methyltransferase (adenine-specific)
MVDGPYGIGGFFGDPRTPDGLADWYEPHVDAWSNAAAFHTTLWFWGTEIGWATVHPVISRHGWDYVQAVHWHKGIQHVAGNLNGDTIRRFPVANEICVFYQRRWLLRTPDVGLLPAKEWMRHEWKRAALPFRAANDACGVKNAASRKYFATEPWLWYPPPPDAMERLVRYANEHGPAEGRPFYSLDGRKPVSATAWSRMRYPWTHAHGLTNVWEHPPVNGRERLRNIDGTRHAPRVHRPKAGVASAHLNQKPLELMRRILLAATPPGGVVWEPFGGLCSASVAALELGRRPYTAEIDDRVADLAEERLAAEAAAQAVAERVTRP